MKKRPRRKPTKPPAHRRRAAMQPTALQYKVVELSTVDEATLEQAVNAWVTEGWTVESVHFAMRESSKRPAMAFVFFTRAGEAAPVDADEARARLHRLANKGTAGPAPAAVSAWERLAQLAASGEGET